MSGVEVQEQFYGGEQKKEILRMALYAGEILLRNGAETYRVEEMIQRICLSRDIKYISAFVTPTVIMVSDDRFDGYSFLKRIHFRDTNLNKVSRVNDFARFFNVHKEIGPKEAISELKKIDGLPSFSNYSKLFCAGAVATIFSILLGGNLHDGLLAFFVSILSIVINTHLQKISEVSFLANFVSSFSTGFLALTMSFLMPSVRYDTIIVGGIMPLLPGFALTNGLRDFISGDLISGSSRVSEAVVIAVSIAFGVGSAFKVFLILGGQI